MKTLRNARGQSVLEMAILLPVILILLYGLEFLRELVMARIRAVQAARFVAWEALARGGGGRGNADLEQALRAMGLGRGLAEVRAEESRRSIGAFAAATPNQALPKKATPPRGLAGLFPEDEGGDFQRRFRDLGPTFRSAMPSELLEQVPADHLALRAVEAVEGASLADAGSPGLFSLHDLLADATGFGREASQSVVTSHVVYRFKGRGFFGALPVTRFRETSSLVVHTFAKPPCPPESTDCDAADGVRGLWLVPNGIPVAPNYDVGPTLLVKAEDRADGARLKARVEGLGATAARLPIVGKALDFKLPVVKPDEFPERELGDDAGNMADGEDGFGAGIGGAGGGPFAEEVGR